MEYVGRPRAAGRPEHVAIGERLEHSRVAAGLTQEQLAEMIDISQADVSKLERGLAILTAHRARQIAAALRISTDQLLGGAKFRAQRANG